MNKLIKTITIALTLFLSACGKQPPATAPPIMTTTIATTTKPTTTCSTTILESNPPDHNINGLTCEQELIFSGHKYDNRTITGNNVDLPDEWHNSSDPGLRRYEHDAYPGCYIVRGPAVGVTFTIANAVNTTWPELLLYKDLTWGASLESIETAYGKPIHKDTSSKNEMLLTNLWYKSDDNSIIIYSISDLNGLVEIECSGK